MGGRRGGKAIGFAVFVMLAAVYAEHEQELWLADAPMIFGARNWRLRIEIASDAVVAVRYRTVDSQREHPSSAPPDRER